MKNWKPLQNLASNRIPLGIALLALTLTACGKEVIRENVDQPNPGSTPAPTITIPQQPNTPNQPPIVWDLPPNQPVQPPVYPLPPQSPAPQLPIADAPATPDLPSDWFDRPVTQEPVADRPDPANCGRGGCKPSLCSDMRLALRGMEEIVDRRGIEQLTVQDEALKKAGYVQDRSDVRARFEGESCTTYLDRCGGGCSSATVCGRQFLVTVQYLENSCGSWRTSDSAIGLRMIVSSRTGKAVVAQVLSQSEMSRTQQPVRSNICR